MGDNFAKFGNGIRVGSLAGDPPNGKGGDIYYNTTFNKLRFFNAVAGIWQNVGSGSGSGGAGINFIDNGDFEEGVVAPAIAYANAAGPTPVDGTGGSPTSTLLINNVNPLSGFFDAIFTKPGANYQGEGWSTAVPIDVVRAGKVLQIDFDYKITGGFVTGLGSDMQVFIYDLTNNVLIPVDTPNFEANTGHFTARFRSVATSINYRLICHVATTSTSAYTMEIDNLQVGTTTPEQVISTADKVLWSGYHDNGYTWNVAGGVFTDFTLGSAGAFVETDNVNFGPVTTAPGNLPGISFTPKAGVKYRVVAKFKTYLISNASTNNFQLWDGTTSIDTSPGQTNANPTNTQGGNLGSTIVLEGYWTAPDGNPATLTIRGQEAGGVSYIQNSFGNTIQWLVEQVTPDTVNIGVSQKVYASQLMQNGTRVTGTAPNQVGQYRSFLRQTPFTWVEANGDPASPPTTVDGIRMWVAPGGAGASDANNNPSRYDIFVGFNKSLGYDFFQSAGKAGLVNTDLRVDNGSFDFGIFKQYNPTTGILTLIGNAHTGQAASLIAEDPVTHTQFTDCYLDVEISDNPVNVGLVGFVGECKFLATDVVPPGTLEFGQAVSRTVYSRLFGAIGTRYGVGDGVTTFDLPPRGYFPRIWDHGSGNDPDAGSRSANNGGASGDNVGSFQDWGTGDHQHSLNTFNGLASVVRPQDGGAGAFFGTYPTNGMINGQPAAETRGKNFYVMGVIVY